MELAAKELMAKRAAEEIEKGNIINLGIGIPTMIANYITKDKQVMIHGENGLLGIGKDPVKGREDPHIINAGGLPCTLVKGSSYFDSAASFAMIRKGKIDITFLGALEVSEKGDLANWIVPGVLVPGMGGGMDLAQKTKKTVILMQHTNKQGKPKLKKECTLPITAKGCVDMVITELGVFKVDNDGLLLTEIFKEADIKDIVKKTEAKLTIAREVKVYGL